MNLHSRRGQATMFIIVALVIVAAIVAYFIVRPSGLNGGVPAEFAPIYTSYDQCIEQETRAALDLAGSQGGHLVVGPYLPGSDYAPFSSQLNFFGFPVPYWWYLSGNGVAKEQIPQKAALEQELEQYVRERLADCDFSPFYAQGFSLEFSQPEVQVQIQDANVRVDVDADVSATLEERSAQKTSHRVDVASNFGGLYTEAVKLYTLEKQSAFLENYSVDVLRLYAPVDGVALGCDVKTWKAQEVVNNLRNALAANIGAIGFTGSGALKSGSGYFTVPYASKHEIRLQYAPNWPSKIEIDGADGELLVAKPVGNQQGLGVLGFCYAPYHFVYDLSFPVLIQISEGDELFQFPVVVVIDKNLPRQGIFSEVAVSAEENDLCQFATQQVRVDVSDRELRPIDASVRYECFDQSCPLGTSSGGVLNAQMPSCFNGHLRARAEGYAEAEMLFSSNENSQVDLVLERAYSVNVSLSVGGNPLEGNAVVTFTGTQTASALLPESTQLVLSEGYYNVSVHVYRNTSITMPASSSTQCQTIPRSDLSGFFGATKEQCFDVTLPETKIESALAGGGNSELYVLASDLERGALSLEVPALPVPISLQQLQYNYEAFDDAEVSFG